ncbi:MAG: AAA family ATPase [Chthoniobacterales bacterium]|nr:AAA family ATPase [Chthoniobacterales bacterium]
MLSSFFVRNFRSILELKLDFSYGEGKAPNGYQKQEILPFLDAGENHRLTPCMAFFGANASGKTNILKALAVFRHLVTAGPKLPEVFEPNLLNPKFSETTFELKFLIEGECFEYRLTYNAKEILDEALSKNGEPLYAIKKLEGVFAPQIISESYSEKKLSDILRVESSDGEGRQTKPFLNRIARGYRGLNSDLSNVFGFFAKSLHLLINSETVLLPVAVEILASTLDGDEDAALREITDVVRRLDIDIAAIDIVQKEIAKDEVELPGITRINQATGAKHALLITSSHKNAAGKLTLLDFIKHESDGTQRLAGLVGLVLYSLKIGGILLVDELECSLHPLLMREIVMLFKTRRTNPKGAQLIFTTHNTDILDDAILRLSEIALVKKTLANGTLVRRLVDLKKDGEDIRNVTNFRKQYLAGFYSGVPHPAL